MDAIKAVILVSVITLWTLLYLAFKNRRGRLQVYPLALILRLGITLKPGRAGRKTIILGWLGFALLILAMVEFYYEVANLIYFKYLKQVPEASSAGLVPFIPGVTVPWSKMPYFLIALGIAVLVHELSHALQARYEGFKVKNAGLALIAFIPAAFVELDEEELSKAPLSSRLRVYSAGVASNMILGLILLGIVASGCGVLTHGVKILSIDEGSPAYLAGLKPGDIIIGVNGEEALCLRDLIAKLKSLGVGDPSIESNFELEILREGRSIKLTVTKPKGQQYIGIQIINEYTTLGLILYPLQMLNIALALINAAPLFITDGGRVLTDILSKLAGEAGKVLSTGIQVATLLLVLSLITITPILPG
ncbi:MAG: site-2 protease family protein [Desulfurococcales archaeon]|nr:site-2 protease family protein [Desulfurococcales archaeon]